MATTQILKLCWCNFFSHPSASQVQHPSYSWSRIVTARRTPIFAATCLLRRLCWLHLYIHLPHYNYNHIRDQSYCCVWGVSYSCFLLPPAHSSCWHSRSYCYQVIITLSWLLTFIHHTAWLLLVVVPQRYGNWDLSLSLRQLWLQLCWCNFHALPKTSSIQLFQIQQDNYHSSYSCCQTISLWLHLH